MIAVVFILVLGVLILIHELGHFFVAKLAGIKVEEFAFGFPPRLFSIKRGETHYSINLIPIGGYVKLLGEDGSSKDHRAFINKPVWQRLFVIISGVIMNLILAVVLLTIGFLVGMTPIQVDPATLTGEKTALVIVTNAIEGYPAFQSGMEAGDVITKITQLDPKKEIIIKSVEDVQNTTKLFAGKEVKVDFKRNKQEKNVSVELRADETPLGVGLVETASVKLGFLGAVKTAIVETYSCTIAIVKFIGNTIGQLVSGQKVSEEISGPVGIYSLTAQAVKLGLVFLLQLTAILSINLAVLNIMPFPALDGGRALFIALEGIFRRKVVREQIESTIHTIGFILLLLLLLAITVKDIIRLN